MTGLWVPADGCISHTHHPSTVQIRKRGWRLWVARLTRRSEWQTIGYVAPSVDSVDGAAVVVDIAGLHVFPGKVEI